MYAYVPQHLILWMMETPEMMLLASSFCCFLVLLLSYKINNNIESKKDEERTKIGNRTGASKRVRVVDYARTRPLDS